MKFEELLDRDGKFVYKTRGVSMLPMLRQERDLVVIEKPHGRLKKYDVPLYRRGDNYVLHRVVSVHKNGYSIRGDNTYCDEFVCDKDIVGVLSSFTRNGRNYSVTDKNYLLYVKIWCAVYPVRKKLRSAVSKAKRFVKKILKYE